MTLLRKKLYIQSNKKIIPLGLLCNTFNNIQSTDSRYPKTVRANSAMEAFMQNSTQFRLISSTKLTFLIIKGQLYSMLPGLLVHYPRLRIGSMYTNTMPNILLMLGADRNNYIGQTITGSIFSYYNPNDFAMFRRSSFTKENYPELFSSYTNILLPQITQFGIPIHVVSSFKNWIDAPILGDKTLELEAENKVKFLRKFFKEVYNFTA